MKAFLQHDSSGLFYRSNDQWVESPADALAFTNEREAESFRDKQAAGPSHPVSRIDPAIYARLTQRAPGVYQIGE
jgi:hypothetical protein